MSSLGERVVTWLVLAWHLVGLGSSKLGGWSGGVPPTPDTASWALTKPKRSTPRFVVYTAKKRYGCSQKDTRPRVVFMKHPWVGRWWPWKPSPQ